MAKAGSVTVVRETERKYEAADAAELPDPAGLPGLATGAAPQGQHLEAVYFDTSDLRLVRAGVTLRLRAGGSDPGWHLKLPVGKDSRDELRMPARSSRRQPPTALVELTQAHSRGAALAPVAQLNTRRRRWVLTDADGHPLAELVEDRVSAHTMGEQTRALSWREEEELAEHGNVNLLNRIARWLLHAGARRSGSSSRLGRLPAEELRAPPGARPPRPQRQRVAWGWPTCEPQAEQLRSYDPLVRRDAPDASCGLPDAQCAARIRQADRPGSDPRADGGVEVDRR